MSKPELTYEQFEVLHKVECAGTIQAADLTEQERSLLSDMIVNGCVDTSFGKEPGAFQRFMLEYGIRMLVSAATTVVLYLLTHM